MTDNTTRQVLSEAQLAQASGGAAYMKLGDIKGSSTASASCQNNLRQLALAAH